MNDSDFADKLASIESRRYEAILNRMRDQRRLFILQMTVGFFLGFFSALRGAYTLARNWTALGAMPTATILLNATLTYGGLCLLIYCYLQATLVRQGYKHVLYFHKTPGRDSSISLW